MSSPNILPVPQTQPRYMVWGWDVRWAPLLHSLGSSSTVQAMQYLSSSEESNPKLGGSEQDP